MMKLEEQLLKKLKIMKNNLIEIAKTDKFKWLRWKAIEKITNQEALIDIAKGEKDPNVQNIAIQRLRMKKL